MLDYDTSLNTVGVNELTPVTKVGDVWLKMDNYFQPYHDLPINGGKVRQCILLLKANYKNIVENYNSTVATVTSVESPQGVIVAKVAKELGLKCIVGYGGNPNLKQVRQERPLIKGCLEMGADVRFLCKLGYDSVLTKKLLDISDTRFFLVKFGMGLDTDSDSLLYSTAKQVSNIPEHIKKVYVPVGSGVTLAGVILGCYQQKRRIHVVGIQIAGVRAREKQVNIILNKFGVIGASWHMKFVDGIAYSKHIEHSIGGLVNLDPIYESKSYIKVKDELLVGDSLFWIVGDSTPIRKYFKGE